MARLASGSGESPVVVLAAVALLPDDAHLALAVSESVATLRVGPLQVATARHTLVAQRVSEVVLSALLK